MGRAMAGGPRCMGVEGHEAAVWGLRVPKDAHGVGGARRAGGAGRGDDKLTIISGCLFLAANIFAITSITNPDWLDTRESVGALTVGLVGQRQTIHGREGVCIPPRLPLEWVTTLFFYHGNHLTVTRGLLVASPWGREATIYVQRIAFTGMMLFCMAALIFPIGFYISEVGGQSYKLPNNTVVGLSYVLFVLSIFFTIVGLLCAAKFICQADECLKCLTLLLFFIFGG
ncbi:hypothetical protein H8959_017180 [Pygathrix nigripes]